MLDDAELLLEAVLTLAPDYRAARYDYADTLVRRHKYAPAREQVGQLLALDPGNPDYRSLAATIAVGLGEHDRAIALYRDMLADTPGSPDVNLWLAHALKTVGRVPEAIDAYRAAAAARPDFGDAYWSLANLKTYRFTDEEMGQMRAGEAAPATGAADRYHLCFALGKALEDRGETAESWHYYARGNALKHSESRYRPEILETNTRNQIETCTGDFFARRSGWGCPEPDPIFILGLPRSGSTLLEQILASHSQVEGTQELADIQRIVVELQGREPDLDDPRYPAALADLSRDDFARLGERYLSDTRAYRTGKPFFIDKMPNNFRHVGLIHLMLPNARIIDARREPMSCCFSNLKQLFANGQEFTYGEEVIARYYRTYLELMRHWDAVLPGRVLRVHHEDVVARTWKAACGCCWIIAVSRSNRPAWTFIATGAAFARQVPNRCASPYSVMDWTNGRSMSPGWDRCATRWATRWCGIAIRRDRGPDRCGWGGRFRNVPRGARSHLPCAPPDRTSDRWRRPAIGFPAKRQAPAGSFAAAPDHNRGLQW